jgi:hypothetical protein
MNLDCTALQGRSTSLMVEDPPDGEIWANEDVIFGQIPPSMGGDSPLDQSMGQR